MATRRRNNGHRGAAEGELRAAAAAGTALLDGVTFRSKAVVYAAIDGLAVVEGDIVIGTVAEVVAATDAASGAASDGAEFGTESIGITGQQFRWPGAVVPFEIDPGLPNPQRVTDAIAHWEANTRIRFRAAAGDTDVVRFVAGGGCSSAVGRRGGVQNITLGSGCSTGNAIHEIGHTVGLWHEQSREDRNQFVTIVFANIAADMQHNFLQQITDGDDLGAYDFGSIMHYPAAAFSTNGQDTIVPKVALPAGVVMGQRTALSAGDVAGVHAMYPGPIVTLKEIPKDPVRDTTKEIAKDPLRETVKESAKDPIRETVKEVPKDPFRETVKEAAKDPIRDGVRQPRTPFVLAGGAGPEGLSGDPAGAEALLTEQVSQLAEALSAVEQERAAILAQLGEAIAALQSLQSGQG
jgi:hypothetical protein